jgi:mediator of RNA polymerase II transcription subunit 12
LTAEEEYQFTVHQQSAQHDDPAMFLSLVRSAIVEYISMRDVSDKGHLPLEDPKLRWMLTEGLRYLVTVDSAAVSESLSINNLPDGCGEFLSSLSTRLLLPDNGEEVQTTFDQILGLANELTLPFCQLKLNLDLSMNQGNPTETDESVDTGDASTSRFELFATAMDRAIEANNIIWTSMLPCLSTDIAHHLRSLAYSRFLGLVPSLKSVSSIEGTSEYRIHMAENLIGVIEAISAGQPSPKTSQLSMLAVEKLVDLGEIIASREHKELLMAVLNHWLPALLRLIILQGLACGNATLGAPSSAGPGGKLSLVTVNCEARARAFLALCNLLLILQCLPPEVSGALSQQVFDVAVVLVDALPDDLRQQCARNVLLLPGMMAGLNVSSDPRLYYLLSTPQPAMADNLVLAHKDKPGTLHGSGGRGMGAMYGIGPSTSHKLSPFLMRRWEMLNESTPNVGENDTSLSLGLFEAIKIQ